MAISTMRWPTGIVLALLLTPTVRADVQPLLGSRENFLTQRIGNRIPADLTFTNESGQSVRMGDLGRDANGNPRPIILVLAYFRCPMLCTMVLDDLTETLGHPKFPFTPGREIEVVVISFDPTETPAMAAAKKRAYLGMYAEKYSRPVEQEGWHFLTGNRENVDRLMEETGFRAIWDERQQQFAHARGIMILTGGGMITHYFTGGAFPPNDLRLAVVSSSEGRVGSPMDRVLLMCFTYDPVSSRYSVTILNAVRAGGILTLTLLSGFWFITWRRSRRRVPAPAAVPSDIARASP